MKIRIILVTLFVLGALFIISNQNLHLGITQERNLFFSTYSGWIVNIFHQAVQVTGYVVRFDWLPK